VVDASAYFSRLVESGGRLEFSHPRYIQSRVICRLRRLRRYISGVSLFRRPLSSPDLRYSETPRSCARDARLCVQSAIAKGVSGRAAVRRGARDADEGVAQLYPRNTRAPNPRAFDVIQLRRLAVTGALCGRRSPVRSDAQDGAAGAAAAAYQAFMPDWTPWCVPSGEADAVAVRWLCCSWRAGVRAAARCVCAGRQASPVRCIQHREAASCAPSARSQPPTNCPQAYRDLSLERRASRTSSLDAGHARHRVGRPLVRTIWTNRTE